MRHRAIRGVVIGTTIGLAGIAGADTIDAGRGPVTVHVPPGYDGSQPTAVVIMLHGYSSSGIGTELYLNMRAQADRLGFLYLFPDGTPDILGNRFWNATNACCDLFGEDIDDSSYVQALFDEMGAAYTIDPRRRYVIGHSNGGFMSHRFACDHAGTVAAIASLAGATFLDETLCQPSEPVHALQIHGTRDTTIRFNGGCIVECYPGAVETVETWAAFDGCQIVPDSNFPNIDLDGGIAGNETTVTKYLSQCQRGGSAELWKIVNGAHSPNLSATFSAQVAEWLLAHPKPCAGDFNNDGVLNVFDFLSFQNAFGGGLPEGDFDGNGVYNVFDFLAFQSAFGEGC